MLIEISTITEGNLVSVKQRHLTPGHAARATSQAVTPCAGAGLYAAFRVFHHQQVAFTCHER